MAANAEILPVTETSVTSGQQAAAQTMPPAVVARATRAGLSVEQALYALLFLLALGLRLYALGSLNLLSSWEAAQAWPVWLGSSAEQFPLQIAPVSPLLSTLQRALFLLTGGGSAFWARFAPACAGAGMVLAAWALRGRMGRGGALALAALFALDPWLLAFSRLADSAILSALTGVLLLAWIFDGAAEASLSTRQIDRLAVVGGLFLISGPLAWLLMPPILFAIHLLRGEPFSRLARGEARRAALLFAATIVIGSTGLLAHISGLASIGESIGVAIAHLTGGYVRAGMVANVYPMGWGLLRLLVDEPFALLFGAGGLIIAILKLRKIGASRRNESDDGRGEENESTQHEDNGGGRGEERDFTSDSSEAWLRVLAVGVVWGLLCLLLPGRTPVSLLVVGLPLLLLAASAVTDLLHFGLWLRLDWPLALPALITMGIMLVTAYFWTGNTTAALRDGNDDPRLTAFYLLIPALGAFFVWWSGARASVQVFGLLTLAAFILAQASSSWMLNLRPESSHSRTLFSEIVDDGLTLLLEDVARLSVLRTGDATEAPVYLLVGPRLQPFFAWHLRAMRHLRWQTTFDVSELGEDALVVSEPGTFTLRLPGDFIGSSYTVEERWLPTDAVGLGPRLRWMLYRERQQDPEGAGAAQEVELWVRRDGS